ncbi:MAG: VOC family protein [Betaproteobacteria bacterium]|nr:VOC family protein [Betaproteobacteria bacterium]
MFTRIDHVMICVPDLQQAIDQYRKLGFNIYPGGVHTGRGTHNAIAFNQDDYIELLAIRDQAGQKAAAGRPGSWGAGLAKFIAAGGGIRYIVLQSDDLVADVSAMRSRGVDVGDAIEGSRLSPAGQELRWKLAVLGPGNPLPIFFIQHLTPMAERREQVPGAGEHPNGVYALERAYMVTEDAEAAAATYAKVLGMPQPPLQRGTVIMSNMAVFQLGPMGLGIVQPYAPGPAADALQRRGPGPFQALYRTTGMGAAARWMQEHGMPPLARGVRNTGEHAMLATPAEACGAYIGFVGPE